MSTVIAASMQSTHIQGFFKIRQRAGRGKSFWHLAKIGCFVERDGMVS